MKTVFILFLLSINVAWACELQLASNLLISGNTSSKWPLAHKNCNSSQIESVHQLLSDQDGKIPVQRLQAALGKEITLQTDAATIQITNLEQFIRRSYTDIGETNIVVHSPFQGNLIVLPENSELLLHCHPCQFNGEEIMRLSARVMSEHHADYNFQAKFTRFVTAYQLRQALPAFSQNLTRDMFDQVKVPSIAYGQYLNDLTKINFFKTNKSLRRGDVIKQSDLSPITLVRAGDRIEIIFENPHVKLKSQALSRQNGGVGDLIEVWNQATGKKHRGVIVDHNRVVVEI